jgi:hypothetical protein
MGNKQATVSVPNSTIDDNNTTTIKKNISLTLFGDNKITSDYFQYLCALVGTASILGMDLTCLHLDTNLGPYKVILRHILITSNRTMPCYFRKSDAAIVIYNSINTKIQNAITTHNEYTGKPYIEFCVDETNVISLEIIEAALTKVVGNKIIINKVTNGSMFHKL